MTQEEYQKSKREVYKVTGILAVVTLIEVIGAFFYEKIVVDPRWPLMVFVSLASLVKAYWIMAVFMHVNHEKKGFIFTILFPFIFLVWAIISFSADGAWYSKLYHMIIEMNWFAH